VHPDTAADLPGDTPLDVAADIPSDLPADIPADVDIPGGCCLSNADCNGGVCVGADDHEFGVCGDALTSGRCWTDTDCADGWECRGAAVCPCMMDCDMSYVGRGICAEPGEVCVTVHPDEILEWCDAASLVVYDGFKCVQTCPGCCECGPWCGMTFQSMEDCIDACTPRDCEVTPGGCYQEVPEEPWWYFDGVGCVREENCTCPGCAGTYMSSGECNRACNGVHLELALDTDGGFAGGGSYDYNLADGTMEIYCPDCATTACSKRLDPDTMRVLYDFADAVPWSAIEPSYISPVNPYCCCDQFIWNLTVSIKSADTPSIVVTTAWCDESFMLMTFPQELKDFLAALSALRRTQFDDCLNTTPEPCPPR
jgi:hypothetical protein